MERQICRQCKKSLPLYDFEFRKGLTRYKTCSFCQRKNNDKESQKDTILTIDDLTNEKLDIILSYPCKIIETDGKLPMNRSYAVSSVINKGDSTFTWFFGTNPIVRLKPGEVHTFDIPIMFWCMYYMSLECSFFSEKGNHNIEFSVREIPEEHRFVPSERQFFEAGDSIISYKEGIIPTDMYIKNIYDEKLKKFKNVVQDRERKEIINFERRNRPFIFTMNNDFSQSLNILELNLENLRRSGVNLENFEILEMKEEKEANNLFEKLTENKNTKGICGQFNVCLEKSQGKFIYKLPIPFFDVVHKIIFEEDIKDISFYSDGKTLMNLYTVGSELDLNIAYVHNCSPRDLYLDIPVNGKDKINFKVIISFFSQEVRKKVSFLDDTNKIHRDLQLGYN